MSRDPRNHVVVMAPGPIVDLEPLGPVVGKNRPNSKTKRKIKKRDGYCCRYCGAPEVLDEFDRSNLTVDHVKAKSKGGTNSVDNLVTACFHCNDEKADKDGYMPMPPKRKGRRR